MNEPVIDLCLLLAPEHIANSSSSATWVRLGPCLIGTRNQDEPLAPLLQALANKIESENQP